MHVQFLSPSDELFVPSHLGLVIQLCGGSSSIRWRVPYTPLPPMCRHRLPYDVGLSLRSRQK